MRCSYSRGRRSRRLLPARARVPTWSPRRGRLRRQEAGAGRVDGVNRWGEVADVDAFGVVEEIERSRPVALRGTQTRHPDPPPVRVLREPGRLTEVVRTAKKVGNRGQVVAVPGDAAQSDQHVRSPAHHHGRTSRAGRASSVALFGETEGAFQRVLGVAEAAEGEFHVGDGQRTPEDVGDVSDAGETLRGGGVGTVRCDDVAGGPEREPHQPGRRCDGEVVAVDSRRARPSAWAMAPSGSPPTRARPGPVHLECGREPRELDRVDDDQVWWRCREESFGIADALLEASEVVARHQRADEPDGEHGALC